MDKFTTAEVNEAKKFGEFFIDLLENHKESVIFYLADTAVLDWFGHTVKGPKNIGLHLRNNAGYYKHHFNAASPCHKIGFRETHIIKYPSETTPSVDKSPPPSENRDNELTPPQLIFTPPNQTRVAEKGQGDGPHNCGDILVSPVKRCKIDIGQGDSSACRPQMKYICAEGSVEFRKKSSKKLQEETKWNRPCKLEVGYSANNFEDCTIYMMIYQGNMKCRRNLLKEFESCEPDA